MSGTKYKPKRGLLTFNSEGNNDPNSIYFSRRAHVPSSSSGVTIGRGYDMKDRSKETIIKDLTKAGISLEESEKLAGGSKLKGNPAKSFIKKKEIREIIISEETQLILFELIYTSYFNNAKRICSKADTEKKYGKCDWENMKPKIRELIADLIYRGDYNPSTRKLIQQSLLSGNKEKIQNSLDKLRKVPIDRQRRRKRHLNSTK